MNVRHWGSMSLTNMEMIYKSIIALCMEVNGFRRTPLIQRAKRNTRKPNGRRQGCSSTCDWQRWYMLSKIPRKGMVNTRKYETQCMALSWRRSKEAVCLSGLGIGIDILCSFWIRLESVLELFCSCDEDIVVLISCLGNILENCWRKNIRKDENSKINIKQVEET